MIVDSAKRGRCALVRVELVVVTELRCTPGQPDPTLLQPPASKSECVGGRLNLERSTDYEVRSYWIRGNQIQFRGATQELPNRLQRQIVHHAAVNVLFDRGGGRKELPRPAWPKYSRKCAAR